MAPERQGELFPETDPEIGNMMAVVRLGMKLTKWTEDQIFMILGAMALNDYFDMDLWVVKDDGGAELTLEGEAFFTIAAMWHSGPTDDEPVPDTELAIVCCAAERWAADRRDTGRWSPAPLPPWE